MNSSATSSATAGPRRSRAASSFFFLSLAGLALWAGPAGCSSTPLQPGDAARGQQLFETRCIGCHTLYPPEAYDRQEWRLLVKRMGPDAGLNRQMQEDVMTYLYSVVPE